MVSSSSGKQQNTKGSSTKSLKALKVTFKHAPTLQYRWSDPAYIDLGYSLLPSEETKRVIVFAAHPAKSNSIWFKERSEIETKKYDDGTKFAEFYPDGKAKLFYPNGCVAIIFKQNKNGYCVQVVQPDGKDPSGASRPHCLAGLFDSLGHGVLYDEQGSVRISYTQHEGILRDTPNGRPVYWKWPSVAHLPEPELEPREFLALEEIWKIYSCRMEEVEHKDTKSVPSGSVKRFKSDASKLKKSQQSVAEGSKKSSKKSLSEEKKHERSSSSVEPKRSVKTSSKVTTSTINETRESNMEWATRFLAQISQKEKVNLHKEKCKCVKFIATPVQTIVLRINEYLSFRLVDQANISLTFMQKKNQLRMELGVIVNPNVQLQTHSIDVRIALLEKVPCSFETYLSHTKSMQKIISHLADLRKQHRAIKNTRRESCYYKNNSKTLMFI